MIIASFALAVTVLPAVAIFCGGKKGGTKGEKKDSVYEDLAAGDKK
ncbi:Variable outer membrane protein [Caenorhabditis elegans]|uniref:Variable outer membrane protein n=1 Tax=Caenorhabditis elegans TaxID=6239 RepID=Q19288_CAEEL|nr:Variable outer membrane protein [Caenorhabditis elegans]CCD65031.2 Variable outer membrane protein [Caenorhabditis elegans]|eukprot:NP_001343625.1 Uncharacterized protein CELE_F10C1.3 [Caenorhabditis elegans]